MAHTPGPWEARPNDGQIVLNGANCYDVQEIYNPQGGFNPDDIRLMAAAPELLAACMALNNCLSDWMEIADSHDRRDADMEAMKLSIAAIAKAEGRGHVTQ